MLCSWHFHSISKFWQKLRLLDFIYETTILGRKCVTKCVCCFMLCLCSWYFQLEILLKIASFGLHLRKKILGRKCVTKCVCCFKCYAVGLALALALALAFPFRNFGKLHVLDLIYEKTIIGRNFAQQFENLFANVARHDSQ